jgi:hypothetical protein
MRKLTINDFSGGIQESTVPDDFSPRQWAQLKGLIPSGELNFESQWPMQTVGSGFTGVHAVFPLASTSGTFLVAIKTDGTIWWAKPPSAIVSYTAVNATTWTRITTAENVGWASGDSATQPSITIQSNEDYKFICPMPVEVHKYVRTPKSGDRDNVSKDKDDSSVPRGVASGVLIHSTTRNGSTDSSNQQALVAYVDRTGSGSVKVIVFPHIRRIPSHGDEGDFINAKVIDGDGDEAIVSVNSGWPLSRNPSVRHHPFTYVDKDGALLPGRGIIPRANVGCMKGGLLLLGDIEWRSNFNNVAEPLDSVPLLRSNGSANFDSTTRTARWPNGVAVTARVLYNEGPGIAYLKGNESNPMGIAAVVTNKALTSNVATLTTDAVHLYKAGDKVEVSIGDPTFDGIFDIVAVPTTTTFTYAKTSSNVASTAVTEENARSFSYQYRLELGQYQEIPNSWTTLRVAASAVDTTLRVARQFNLATHILNDDNTGPYRGGVYFSAGEIDSFDPRAVLIPGKTDVQILGMHTLNDEVIVITSHGSDQDGVYRIRGQFSRLIRYDESAPPDPGAVRLELIRGGLGGPTRTAKTHRNFSCVWSEAGVVVFIDRLGGIWYTNGQTCDRLDRYGPKSPRRALQNDHVAAFGKHVLVWRDNRLLCFTVMSSEDGGADGCWTEINVPGTVSSMVGGQSELFFVHTVDGVANVARLSPTAPDSERGTFNGQPLEITVSTATFGDVSSHQRTTWHRFGMTFMTPTSCTVKTVRVQSTGALTLSSPVTAPDVTHSVTLNRTFSDRGTLGEFTVPAGIGPQASCSATVTFEGYVQLQSASFWVTGQDPRIGDQ